MKRIISILTGLTMLLGTAASLPVCAEEPVKNWDYYWNLDDYSVYKEYVETYGKFGEHYSLDDHEPDTELPKETDLPWYDSARFYITNGSINFIMPFIVTVQDTEVTAEQLREKEPSYFGFPDEWSFEDDGRESNVLQIEYAGKSDRSLGFDFDVLSRNGSKEIPVIRSTVDVYRLHLTLEHSAFAQACVKPRTTYEGVYQGSHEIFIDPLLIAPSGAADVYCIPGDPNNDGAANASDAAAVLIEAAALGAGNASGFTATQTNAADVNGDHTVNSSDAAVILQYAAAVGGGDRYAKLRDFTK